jgi:tetratricopeptide (TPR) repeat protein
MRLTFHLSSYLGLLLAANTAAALTLDPGTSSRIATARQQIAKNPAQPDGYTLLALSLVKAARETDCPDHLKQAEQAVANAFRIAPGDFEASKAQVALLLAQARYEDALAEAKGLNQRVPDDNLLYGYLADAQMALGDYASAEKSVQRMIDQRPVNAPGFERGAQLRDDFGYGGPSLEWWNSALRITSPWDVEERAWILTNMSRVALRMGKAAEAQKSARQALELVAGYPLANDALAAAMLEQGQAGGAAVVLRRRLDVLPDGCGSETRVLPSRDRKGANAPSLETLCLNAAAGVRAEFHLAEALERAGQNAEAAAAFAQFEKDALVGTSQPDNANRELIEYFAAHQRAPEAVKEAVKLGQREAQRRQDIFTLSAYAQALAAAGDYVQARIQIEVALDPGIRDAGLFLQAGLIAAKLNDVDSALNYLRKAVEINASSTEAAQALELLANIQNNSTNSRFIHR